MVNYPIQSPPKYNPTVAIIHPSLHIHQCRIPYWQGIHIVNIDGQETSIPYFHQLFPSTTTLTHPSMLHILSSDMAINSSWPRNAKVTGMMQIVLGELSPCLRAVSGLQLCELWYMTYPYLSRRIEHHIARKYPHSFLVRYQKHPN